MKIHLEDRVLDALRELGGRGLTSKIAGEAELPENSALVCLGKLNGEKVEKVPEASSPGNPCWRLKVDSWAER